MTVGPAIVPTYRDVVHATIQTTAASAAITDAIVPIGAVSSPGTPTTAGAAQGCFSLKSADYSLEGYTLKLRLRATVLTNAVAPGQNIVVNLKPVSAVAGGSGFNTITIGAATATTTFTTPALSTITVQDAADVTFPADGLYVFTTTWTGAFAANANIVLACRLMVRAV